MRDEERECVRFGEIGQPAEQAGRNRRSRARIILGFEHGQEIEKEDADEQEVGGDQ